MADVRDFRPGSATPRLARSRIPNSLGGRNEPRHQAQVDAGQSASVRLVDAQEFLAAFRSLELADGVEKAGLPRPTTL